MLTHKILETDTFHPEDSPWKYIFLLGFVFAGDFAFFFPLPIICPVSQTGTGPQAGLFSKPLLNLQ